MIVGAENVVACTHVIMDLFFSLMSFEAGVTEISNIQSAPAKLPIRYLRVFSRRCVVYFGVKCGINWCVTQREKLSHLALPWLSHGGPSGEVYFIPCMKDDGFGGLGVACWPLVPKFAGSNPAEAVGFLRAIKSSARLPSEGK